MNKSKVTIFQEALKHTLGIEGGYSNHKSDPGGKTMFGITERVAQRHGYVGDMKSLPMEVAIDIYHADYWIGMNLDLVADCDKGLALEMFDTGVNMSIHYPQVWLQEGLNLFNRRGKDWPDILEDGEVGRVTIKALRSLMKRRGDDGIRMLLKYLNVQQGARYAYLARRNQKFEDFVYGWYLRRV